MKRRFTYLLTALALLAFLSPTTAWGGVKLADTQQITQKTAHETMLGEARSPMNAQAPERWEGETRENITETMTSADLAATSTTYTEFSNVSLTNGSDAIYAGQSAKDSDDNIQLRSKNSNSGIVSTTSGGKIKSIKITVASGNNTISVYGNNTAYTSASDLYSTGTNSNQGTLIQEITSTTTITVTTDYSYVGIRSKSGAIYISSIEFTWEPANSSSVAAPTFSPASGTEFGDEGLEVTISQADNEAIYYTLDGTDPDNTSTEYTQAIGLATTTTIKAIAYDGEDYSSIATATYTYVDPNAPGTENNPYTVADIIEMGSSLPSGTVYVSGIVSSFQGDHILDDGSYYRYYISEDGVEEDEIRVYKGNGLNNQAFANADDVLIGDHVVICGELSIYGNMTQFNAGNYIYSLYRPASYTLTVSSLSHAEMFVYAGNVSEPLFEGEGSGSVVEGASVILSVEPENDYELTSLMVDGVEHVNDINGGAYTFNMPDHDVEVTVTTTRLPYYTVNFTTDGVADGSIEVTQGQPIATLPTATAELIPNGYTFVGWYTDNYTNATTAPNYVTSAFVPTSDITLKAVFAEVITPAIQETWTKITDLSEVTEGVYALISGDGYAFNGTMASGHGQSTNSAFSFTNDVATSAPDGTCELTLDAIDNGFTMYNAAYGYLYATKAGSGGLAWHETESSYWNWSSTTGDNGNWVYVGSNYAARLRVYNNTFRTYNTDSNAPLFMAQKTPGTPAVCGNYTTSSTAEYSEFTLEIDGYGAEYDPETNNNAGYYLIASPVSEAITPNQNNGFLSGNYDLYRFDQQQELEWVNYKAEPFEIESGKGYLYASYDGTTLNFCGTEVVGEYDEEVWTNVVDVTLDQGWNLIGNPFSNEADLLTEDYDMKDYYKINDNGNELVPAEDPHYAYSDPIYPMQGVLVWGEEDGEVVFFAGGVNRGGAKKSLSINIRKNRSNVIDRAMVRFNGGGMLPKFQLNPRHTKVYITEGNKDYAVVRSASEAELPVSFRASENGTYTLSVEVNNVEMNYLHLIDNMTGADVDLLATPSYTFEAKTSDYASRFRLVFSANSISEDADGDNAFAYYNGTNWTISNMGEATLQVVDVMGRMLSSETLSGNAEVNINQPTGVYMLRLVNGDNVKVQKVVVR